MPQTVIDRYDVVEKKALAESMLYLVGDFTEEAHEAGYTGTVQGVHGNHSGYPDMTAQLSKMLGDKATVQKIIGELDTFITELAENRELLRFRYHRCTEIMEKLDEYLANLDFDVMVAQAGEWYQQKHGDRDFLDNVDPVAVRQKLAERGIVNGQVVDEDALNNDPFIRQVMADAEAAQGAPSASTLHRGLT